MSECHADCEVFNGCAECAEAEVGMSDRGRRWRAVRLDGDVVLNVTEDDSNAGWGPLPATYESLVSHIADAHNLEVARLRDQLLSVIKERGTVTRELLDTRAEIARLRERLDAAVAERGFIARDVLDGRALRKVILDAWSAINNGPVAAYQPPFVRNTRRTLERAVKELKGEAQ